MKEENQVGVMDSLVAFMEVNNIDQLTTRQTKAKYVIYTEINKGEADYQIDSEEVGVDEHQDGEE